MKWILIILFVSSVYSDARPKESARQPKGIAKPLEDLIPMLDTVTGKLNDLSQKLENL